MNTRQITKIMILAAVSGFSACTITQNPAPVINGGPGIAEPQSTAAPYSPPAARPAVATYPAAGSAVAGTYIPSAVAVDPNARRHTVVRGDTVYNLAQRYGISQADLCQWNNISNNIIALGQVLYVKNPGTENGATVSVPPVAAVPADGNGKTVAGITWIKPAAGTLSGRYSPAAKGIEITGQPGSAVKAAADGQVIFSGVLDGYGKLIIIQHNPQYLTAYANNQSNQFQEGANVKRGQVIAAMGADGKNKPGRLHFELRKDGHSVDPLVYLPAF